MNIQKNLVVISGPSGCGKDTVVKRIRELHPEFEFSVSATSRAPRPGEVNGVDYRFVGCDEFEKMISDGEILEFTQYNGNYYGTPKSEVDKRIQNNTVVILVIETEGAANISRIYPDAATVFLLPPSMEELERRLRGRGTENEETIQNRLAIAKREMEKAQLYKIVVTNDRIDRCADEIYQKVMAYRMS